MGLWSYLIEASPLQVAGNALTGGTILVARTKAQLSAQIHPPIWTYSLNQMVWDTPGHRQGIRYKAPGSGGPIDTEISVWYLIQRVVARQASGVQPLLRFTFHQAARNRVSVAAVIFLVGFAMKAVSP